MSPPATPDRKVALACLAHPDDAEILCGGTLARLAEAGWEVHVATLTPGDCGTMTDTPWQISATRTSEGQAAAAIISAAYHCLDERDALVVYDKPTLHKTLDLFRHVAPSLVFTHAPKDYMMDHEMTSLLVRAATFAYGAPNVTTRPRHPQSMIPWLYYCDPVEGVDPLGRRVTPTTYVNVSEHMEVKTKMLAAHASQREWLRAHHGMDEYVESMRRFSASRGEEIGCAAAEAFVQHRGHAYPASDLLHELFGNGPTRP